MEEWHLILHMVTHLKKTNERIRKSTEKGNKIMEENTIKGLTRTLQCEREALEYYKDV